MASIKVVIRFCTTIAGSLHLDLVLHRVLSCKENCQLVVPEPFRKGENLQTTKVLVSEQLTSLCGFGNAS